MDTSIIANSKRDRERGLTRHFQQQLLSFYNQNLHHINNYVSFGGGCRSESRVCVKNISNQITSLLHTHTHTHTHTYTHNQTSTNITRQMTLHLQQAVLFQNKFIIDSIE